MTESFQRGQLRKRKKIDNWDEESKVPDQIYYSFLELLNIFCSFVSIMDS